MHRYVLRARLHADEGGDTPLRAACSLGYEEMVQTLLSLGANPNIESDIFDPPLHDAASHGYARIVDLLLEAGADAEYRTMLDETIRDALPRNDAKRDRVVAVLRKHGIEV